MPGKPILLPPGTEIPNHIAIIPDGNRRWARARGLHTLKGHKKGFDRAVEVARAAREIGVHTATLWGFSTENWDRTEEEISYLMKLYHRMIDIYLKEAKKDQVQIFHLGRKDRLPKPLLDKIAYAEKETKDYQKHILNIALDYGGQDEIIRIVRKIASDKISSDKINRELFTSYSDLSEQPYPYVDLMIRSSGEQRTSGFLLWESAYTEYYWENDHFPDFTPEKLKEAVLDYSRRRRRFGGNDEEEHFKFKPEVIAALEINWWRLENIPEGTKFREYAVQHLAEQFGMSASLAKEAAHHMLSAILLGKKNKWNKSVDAMKLFYELVKEEIKLAFEPSVAASLQVKFWKDINKHDNMEAVGEVEDTAKQLYSEVYRISAFQAAKIAHLRVLAQVEKNMAEKGMGDHHWDRAEDYLEKFYSELKQRVA